jgi:hypothetical protein
MEPSCQGVGETIACEAPGCGQKLLWFNAVESTNSLSFFGFCHVYWNNQSVAGVAMKFVSLMLIGALCDPGIAMSGTVN